jgi:sugar phosphate isomerase/epimerase
MKLRLACADFTFPLLKHDQSLQLISMLGIKGVDIGLFEGRSHLWPSNEFKNLRRSARALKRKLDDKGLKAADLFLQMDPDFKPYAVNHPQARQRRKARDWFLKTLDYTAECGGKHITGLPGAHFEEESAGDSFERAVDELSWRIAQAKSHGIVYGVEAHIGSIAPRPQAALKLLQRTPGLTLTLDYTHFTRLGIADPKVEPLVPYASHFHARGGRRGRLQTNFSRNTVDYKRVYQVMQETGYKGWIGIEYVWIDWERCNESDNISETILLRDFFRSLAG